MTKNNHYVYKLINPETGEFYYGSRSCNCSADCDEYMGSMKKWKPNKNLLLKEIVKANFSNRNEAIEYEIYLIKMYIHNPLNRNYYIPTIGFVNKFHTNETKQKISRANSGRKFSEEHRKKLSETRIKKGIAVGDKNGMFGKIHTKESKSKMGVNIGKIFSTEVRKRMSRGQTGRKKTTNEIEKIKKSQPRARWINQYNMIGVVLNTFISIAEAARQTQLHASAINMCCLGYRNQHGGYKWKYKV